MKTLVWICVWGLVLLGVGCSGTRETDEAEGKQQASTRPSSPDYVELDLVPADTSVRTIQLYRTGDEAALPVITLGANETLSLEFDLLTETGRPLSVYFYHADRVWRRDLSPAEYLTSFQHDNVFDYSVSMATQVPYVHYNYQFPNRSIGFTISGNYIVRVTEQGREEEVLFERAFFVTEQSTSLEFATDQVLIRGYDYPSIQPFVAFRPPGNIQGNVFDYKVCFVRNGRLGLARCAERPSLAQQPVLQFYLEPEVAFEPEGADYFMDLGNLRVGRRIERADFTARPFEVILEPDYARFSGSEMGPMLNGQSVVSRAVVGTNNPDIGAEYVKVRFSYVPPDEQRLSGEVVVTGSFNNWQYDPANQLSWVPDRGRYEGEVLIKQGQHEYRYMARDRRLLRARQENLPRMENHYAAFVYYSDLQYSTDRLLAVRQAVGQ